MLQHGERNSALVAMPIPMFIDGEGCNVNSLAQVATTVAEVFHLFLSALPVIVDVVLHNFIKVVERLFVGGTAAVGFV
jgi:hypothetical protein